MKPHNPLNETRLKTITVISMVFSYIQCLCISVFEDFDLNINIVVVFSFVREWKQRFICSHHCKSSTGNTELHRGQWRDCDRFEWLWRRNRCDYTKCYWRRNFVHRSNNTIDWQFIIFVSFNGQSNGGFYKNHLRNLSPSNSNHSLPNVTIKH